jgi:hypothetical protein
MFHRFVQILFKIQFITKEFDDFQLVQKIGLFISYVLRKNIKPNANEVNDYSITSKSS